jgi:hypothetical protein
VSRARVEDGPAFDTNAATPDAAARHPAYAKKAAPEFFSGAAITIGQNHCGRGGGVPLSGFFFPRSGCPELCSVVAGAPPLGWLGG